MSDGLAQRPSDSPILHILSRYLRSEAGSIGAIHPRNALYRYRKADSLAGCDPLAHRCFARGSTCPNPNANPLTGA